MDNAAESLLSLALPIHGSYVFANEQTDFLFNSLRVYAAIYRARNVRTKSTHFSPFSLKIVNIRSISFVRHTPVCSLPYRILPEANHVLKCLSHHITSHAYIIRQRWLGMGGEARAQAGGGARCLFGKLALVARASDADAADALPLSFSPVCKQTPPLLLFLFGRRRRSALPV